MGFVVSTTGVPVCTLYQVNAVIDSLNGSLWKLHCALANLKGAPEPSYQMKNCIECTRDKQVQYFCG